MYIYLKFWDYDGRLEMKWNLIVSVINVIQTLSEANRNKVYRFFTDIRTDNRVIRRPVYSDGTDKNLCIRTFEIMMEDLKWKETEIKFLDSLQSAPLDISENLIGHLLPIL